MLFLDVQMHQALTMTIFMKIVAPNEHRTKCSISKMLTFLFQVVPTSRQHQALKEQSKKDVQLFLQHQHCKGLNDMYAVKSFSDEVSFLCCVSPKEATRRKNYVYLYNYFSKSKQTV